MADPISLDPLRNFFRASRGGSQEQIILEFLEAVIVADDLIVSGSVLITDKRRERLVLFNEDDVLFRKRILDSDHKSDWPSEIPFRGSEAGLAYRTQSTVTYTKGKSAGKDFFGNSPIENMICIPIIPGGTCPFGVVCFHNNIKGQILDPIRERLESYVEVLALALHVPLPELRLENNIFIVHGRDQMCRQALELMLMRYGANPKVLANEDKNAESILAALEDLIRKCKAGFILMTPDDEGRLYGDDTMSRRARENVIFEAGLLFARFRQSDRVCLLLQQPTALPSDLKGIVYEEFREVADLEARIARRLKTWGIDPARRQGHALSGR